MLVGVKIENLLATSKDDLKVNGMLYYTEQNGKINTN